MTQNKKFGLITFFSIFLPIFLAFFNYYESNLKNFEWGYDHANGLTTIAIVMAIIGCVFILKQNSKSKTPNMVWRTVLVALLVIFIFYLLLGYSFNFGF